MIQGFKVPCPAIRRHRKIVSAPFENKLERGRLADGASLSTTLGAEQGLVSVFLP